MIGAGTIINPILKVATTVAILAAVYFFIVRPVLDTTEDVTRRSFDAQRELQQGIHGDIQESIRRAQRLARDAGSQVKIPATAADSQAEARKLIECIQAASQDVAKIQACNARFSP